MTYFTKTELEILNYIEQGVVEKHQLAEKLFISNNTLTVHLSNLRKKLGCCSFSELVYKSNKYRDSLLISELNNTFKKFGYEIVKMRGSENDK